MVVTVGVCCMDVKLFSRPMAAILNRLKRYDDITIVPFGNRCIFDNPVEAWPIVDFLICFYSAGFPLAKAEEYIRLRNPICFNDVLSQCVLLDRTAIYEKLKANGIPVPTSEVFRWPPTSTAGAAEAIDFRQMVMDQKNEEPTPEEIQALAAPTDPDDDREDRERKAKYWGPEDPIQENEDCITVNGRKFKKPFVEKPVFAEDHNIYIYYPRSSGGGSKRLFRKIGNRSSKFYPNVSTVRRGGSFIYEEFVSTDGMDIKVYTVGLDYAHAEARKAPTVDGRVKRTAEGKEVRYHVILTQAEKEIARKITQLFGQNICGFDIMRSEGISYACDVNGWSFVKGSPKYYNDAAQIIYEMIHFRLHPMPTTGLSRASLLLQENDGMTESPAAGQPSTRGKELRCLLAVVRHGDRTPKQKVKVKVTHPRILAFFDGKDPHAQVKLKSAKELEEFASAIDSVLAEDAAITPQLQLTPRGSSKVKPKYTSRSASPIPDSRGTSPLLSTSSESILPLLNLLDDNGRSRLREIQDELNSSAGFSGINRKVQIKPLHWHAKSGDDSVLIVDNALLIYKFGGQLTEFGTKQADFLGKRFRQQMYSPDRSGMLSLHSSFAHDVKFYASDEGRVQMTAAVFARSFLELDEEEVIPILYALVWNDRRANMLLEHSCSDSTAMMTAKRQLATIMNSDIDFSDKGLDPKKQIDGVTVEELRRFGLGKLGNPYRRLHELRAQLEVVRAKLEMAHKSLETSLSRREALARMTKSWAGLAKAFFDKERQKFDISKVPEVADALRFLLLHTGKGIGIDFSSIYTEALPLASWTVAQEYGVTEAAKREISEEVIRPLVNKIVSDLRQMRERKQLQTVSRFYFTSESHLLSLHNVIESRLGFPMSGTRLEDYIAHFVFKMWEDMAIPINDPRRFTVEIWHSQGSNAANVPDPPGTMHNFTLPLRPIKLDMTLDGFIKTFS